MPPPMTRWVYFWERKEVRLRWSSVLPISADKKAVSGVLLSPIQRSTSKKGRIPDGDRVKRSKKWLAFWPKP